MEELYGAIHTSIVMEAWEGGSHLVVVGLLVVCRVIWAQLSPSRHLTDAPQKNSRSYPPPPPLTCPTIAWATPEKILSPLCDKLTVSWVVDPVDGPTCMIVEELKKM